MIDYCRLCKGQVNDMSQHLKYSHSVSSESKKWYCYKHRITGVGDSICVLCQEDAPLYSSPESELCKTCGGNGRGYLVTEKCSDCYGSGKSSTTKE